MMNPALSWCHFHHYSLRLSVHCVILLSWVLMHWLVHFSCRSLSLMAVPRVHLRLEMILFEHQWLSMLQYPPLQEYFVAK
ncbi:hypothetical protein LINGRAHAP2_LOCUS16531 [Linum grandiflorum]